MNYQQRKSPAGGGHKISRRSFALGALFVAVVIAAVCVDVTGVLEYFKVVAGAANDTLEAGAAITVGAIAPLLAAGFSVSADLEENERAADERA